ELLDSTWESPVALGAGPLTRNSKEILKAAGTPGLGAIVSKTAYYQDRDTPRPTMAAVAGGLINFDWSGSSISRWEDYYNQLQDCSSPVFASFYDSERQRFLEMGSRLIGAGARALEVPIKTELTPTEVEKRFSLLARDTKAPLVGKVGSSLPGLEEYCLALEEGGAAAISGINTIGPCLVLDKDGTPFLGNKKGYGYLSGTVLKEMALATVYRIKETVDLPVIAGGGISSARDVVDFLRAGASAVFLVTGAILQGLTVFEQITADLKEIMAEMGVQNLEQIRGSSRELIRENERWSKHIPVIDEELCTGCGRCVRSCIYDSLMLEDNIAQHREQGENCFGCGLCITVCPVQAIN
ncbi:MAG: 4Fe-4S binding protein, partial [Bacillota bacterium]